MSTLTPPRPVGGSPSRGPTTGRPAQPGPGGPYPDIGWADSDPTVDPSKATAVVPRVYGRARVKPVLVYSANTYKGAIGCSNLLGSYGYGTAVDAVLAICQAGPGVAIRGVWRGDDYGGLKLNSSGAWVQSGPTVDYCLQSLGTYTTASVHGDQNHQGSIITTWSGFEYVTASTGPVWGKRGSGTTVQNLNDNNPPAPTWTVTDLTGPGISPPAWGQLTGAAAGMAFAGLCHVRFPRLLLQEGTAKLPDIQFLVDGVGGGPNCPPGDAIRDVLTNLVGLPASAVITNQGPDGLYASSADAYWASMGSTFTINRAVTGSTADTLQELLQAVNCELVFSGGYCKVLPLGDMTLPGGYVPSASAYSIGPSDIAADGLVKVDVTEDREVFNAVPVRYKDAAKGFADAIYTFRDDFDAATRGRITADAIDNKWISSAAHAAWLAQALVLNALRNRRTLSFKLISRYQLLEPGDLLSVNDGLGGPTYTVRVTEIEEDSDFTINVVASEWSGAATPVDLTPETPSPAVPIPCPDSAAQAKQSGDAALVVAQAAAAARKRALPMADTMDGYLTDKVSDWTLRQGSWAGADILNASLNGGPGQDGGAFLRANTVWADWNYPIPFDPNRLYRLRVRVRQAQGPTTGLTSFYAGLAGVAADGVTLVNVSGGNTYSSQHYGPGGVALPNAGSSANTAAPGAWTEFKFYWKGWGGSAGTGGGSSPLSPGVLHPNVRYLRPVFILDLDGNGIQDLDVIELTDGSADLAQAVADQAKADAATAGGNATTASTKAQQALDGLAGKVSTDFSNVGDGSIGSRLIKSTDGLFQKLVIGDLENRCTNPSGEGGNGAGWFGTVTYRASSLVWPSYHDFLQTDRDGYNGQPFPVSTGDRFWCSFDGYTDSGTLGNLNLGLALYTTQTAVDADSPTAWYVGATRARGAGAGHQEGVVTIPSGYAFARVWTQIGAPVGACGVAAFRAVQVRRMNGGELIVDGAITASKILAGAVTADAIAADALKTSNYNESGGYPTAGAKLDKNGTALKVASNSVLIGGTYLQDVGVITAAASVRLGSAFGLTWGSGISSVARVDRGSGTVRYSVRVTVTRGSTSPQFMVCPYHYDLNANAQMIPVLIGSTGNTVDVAFKGVDGVWYDPTSTSLNGSGLHLWSFPMPWNA